jgi:hypothetical protein
MPHVDYDAIAQHFLVPRDTSAPLIDPPGTPARRLRDACEAIATIGWWSRSAADGCVGLGHGFFDAYVWGRAASMGSAVSAPVVVAAFGVFDEAMLSGVLEHGRSVSSQESILAARAQGASEGLAAATREIDVAVLESFADPLLRACEGLDGMGRPLFGALRALPTPADVHGRAWRAAELVREHRGDGHIAALVVAGLDKAEASVLTEVWLGYPVGEYSTSRGLTPEHARTAADALRARGWVDAGDAITPAGRSARDDIEAATDRSQQRLIDALGDDLERVIDNGTTITEAVLRAQAAPADPRKRAAG